MLYRLNESSSRVQKIDPGEVAQIAESLKSKGYRFWKQRGPTLFVSLNASRMEDIFILSAEVAPILPRIMQDIVFCAGGYAFLGDESEFMGTKDGLVIVDFTDNENYYYGGELSTVFMDFEYRDEILEAVLVQLDPETAKNFIERFDELKLIFLMNDETTVTEDINAGNKT